MSAPICGDPHHRHYGDCSFYANPESAPLDLDAIRARAEAATAGPWVAGRENVNELHWTLPANTLDRNGRRSYVAESESLLPDWEFIARARTDVPALIAEVERLRADSVPRSALVQVGWVLPNVGRPAWLHLDDARWGHDHAAAGCQPVFAIRENTDGR